jgi:hypothetical protein
MNLYHIIAKKNEICQEALSQNAKKRWNSLPVSPALGRNTVVIRASEEISHQDRRTAADVALFLI